ncbi:MAG: restriction endonuclease subunit S [Clostridium sp.]
MGDKVTKLPNIRFSGFEDAWKHDKFNEVFTYLKNNSLSRAELNYDEGTVKNVHYGDILIKFGEVLDTENYEIPYVSNKDFKVENTSLLQTGDIVIADAAEDNTVGKCSEIKLTEEIDIVSGLHTIPCRPIVEFGDGYLGYYMNSNAYHDQLLQLIQGSKVSSISKSALKNTNIIYPNIDEQKSIGNLFINLDKIIILHKHKLELVKETKKSMLQKMFPKDGRNVPEFRFVGFTDEWKAYKLSDVAEYRNGRAHEKDINEDGAFIVVNSKFVSTNGLVKKFSNKLIEPLKSGEIAFVLSDVPKGKALARTFLINEDEKYSLNQRIAGVTPLKETDSYFLNILMNRNDYFLKFDNGVGQTNLSKSEVESFLEFYPCYEEQVKIGDYFNGLDNIITIHQRELDLLKGLKKTMLKQMFI